MKHFPLFTALLLLLICCGKTEDSHEQLSAGNGEQVIPTMVNFSFNVTGGHLSKASSYQHSSYSGCDDAVEWFDYYIYDSEGGYVSSGRWEAGDDKSSLLMLNPKGKYTLYAIANDRALSSVPLKEENILNEYYNNISEGTLISEVDNAPRLIMSGVSSLVYGQDGFSASISFKRLVSRISLCFDISELNSDVLLSFSTISLSNVPSRVKYFKDNSAGSHYSCISTATVNGPFTPNDMVDLYCYENIQGELLPGNTSNSTKFFPSGSPYESICTYLTLSGSYSSPRKRGNISYRLYPGRSCSDFSIDRNSNYIITVKFSGEGSVDDISWRVVRDDIKTLATGLDLSLGSSLLKSKDTTSVEAHIEPADVSSRHLLWSVSPYDLISFTNPSTGSSLSVEQINSMENNLGPYLVYGIKSGSGSISVASTDGTSKSSSAAFKVDLEPPVPYKIGFKDDIVPMWFASASDGETVEIPYSDFSAPVGEIPTAETISGSDFVEIVSVTRTGVKVRALGLGNSLLKVIIGDKSASLQCQVTQLALNLNKYSLSFKAGYSEDVDYSISPAHASNMALSFAFSNNSSSFSSSSQKFSTPGVVGNTISFRSKYFNDYNSQLNSGSIKVSISGHDISQTISYAIESPLVSCISEQVVYMNASDKYHNSPKLIDVSENAAVDLKWFRDLSSSGVSGTASTPVEAPLESEVIWNRENCTFTYKSPGTQTNGHYRLLFSLNNDFSDMTYIKPDGTAGTASDFTDAHAKCSVDFKFVERIYIISYIKTDSRDSEGKYKYHYCDELMVRCVKHPLSEISESLVSSLQFDYKYNGTKYHYSGEQDTHTGITIDYDVTFVVGKEYDFIEWSSSGGEYYNSSFTFNGKNAPKLHFEGHNLVVPSYGNIANTGGFWYAYSARSSGLCGYCNTIEWDKVYRGMF